MRVLVTSTKSYDREFLSCASGSDCHEFTFVEAALCLETASFAMGYDAICIFVNDQANDAVIDVLYRGGVRVIALRCAGFNNVDLDYAKEKNIAVVRVPAYSPHAVAEHALGLVLCLNRRIHRAFNRVREGNFSLHGLLGFDIHKKTIGIIGTGRIGAVLATIFLGLGCRVLANDSREDIRLKRQGVCYVDQNILFAESHIISLHCPLTHETYHLINDETIASMQEGVMLINTSRGALVDTSAVIRALKSSRIGAFGIDVYEEESDIFFEDRSDAIIQDDVFARLTTFPNVLITCHQAFFTIEALSAIAHTTVMNLSDIEAGRICSNDLTHM